MIPALAILKVVPAKVYIYGAIAITIIGLAWYGDHQRGRANKAETALVDFKAKVTAAGEQAKKDAARQVAADLRNKERADEDRKRNMAATDRELVRLRANNASRGFVPPAPANSSRPELVAYDRAEFDRALRAFDAGAIGLVGEGAKNTVELDAARRWGQGR